MKTRQLLSKTLFVTVFSVASLFTSAVLRAQVKIGTNPTSINSAAILDVESADKGILFPRVALTATNSAAPLAAHVAGMTVYNTATAGSMPFNVTPGLYYNDGSKWSKTGAGVAEADLTYIKLTDPTQLINNVVPWSEFKFQSETGDAANEYNPTTGKFTIVKSGLYILTFNAFCYCPTAPFETTLNIDINDLQYSGPTQKSQTGAYFSSSLTLPMKLNPGDVIYPRVQASVTGCTIASNYNKTFMTLMQIK